MQQNLPSNPQMEIETIYSYDKHSNIPWNIVEYQPMKHYESSNKPIPQTQKYVTKKGFYMDEHIKNVKDLPSPSHYQEKSFFDQTQNKKDGKKIKINPRLKKGTYLENLEREKKHMKSGVGSYNLEKTQKQLKQELKQQIKRRRKIKEPQRPSFYEDTQCMSLQSPGAGLYNPHLEVQHITKDRMVPQKWINKHKQESKHYLRKKRKEPSPFSYRPTSAGTFDRKKFEDQKMKKKSHSMNKGFGTDAKFAYDRVNRKKIMEKRPAPNRYSLTLDWKRKSESKLVFEKQLSTRSMSVYH